MITPNHLQIKFAALAKLSNMKIQLDQEVQFSDEEFFLFCQENRELKFERTKDGNIIVMTPTRINTGGRNSEINADLTIWCRQTKYGKTFDSSTGFTLPDGSILSPDASVIAWNRLNQLTNVDKKRFGHICPEFVIELKSETDRIATLQTKMQNWLANGVQLGWLIDPNEEKAYIYRPQQAVEVITGFDNTLSGEEVLKGFELDLSILR